MNTVLNLFRVDSLSAFIGIFIAFFSILITIYSIGFMQTQKGIWRYCSYILLTYIASLGVIFAGNLILFIVFWGFSGLLLYLLIGFGEKENTSSTAKKAFIIIGGSDAIMLLGIALVWRITGSFNMTSINIPLTTKLAVCAYLCLAIGAFAKAGAMPFHTWIPDTAEDAPVPVTAYLPASLDKLLGIYFLVRISLHMFRMDLAMNNFLMFIGSFTIIAAVMMALIQHDLKRLLGYHAVSQVGYMVLGIGTGNPLGIAGGLFHMLNNTIYKSCLFLGAGAVEKKAQTSDLEKLGGLAKFMPITFITFLTASLAISGIPPFNGFVSKWMIYQGVIETSKAGGYIWIVWLICALFGSALTLASFMKLVHAVFLGQPSKSDKRRSLQETKATMWIPTVILGFLCFAFGVFAYRIPLKLFILPSLQGSIEIPGFWSPSLVTVLIIIGFIVGGIIYFLGTAAKARQTDIFVGGETVEEYPDMRVSGSEFYNTIKEINILKGIYNKAQAGWFDIYEQGRNFILALGGFFQYLHNGILPTYLVWILLGMLGLFWVLLK